MKPRLGDWVVTIDFLQEVAITFLSNGSRMCSVQQQLFVSFSKRESLKDLEKDRDIFYYLLGCGNEWKGEGSILPRGNHYLFVQWQQCKLQKTAIKMLQCIGKARSLSKRVNKVKSQLAKEAKTLE
uniref:Uncharacterized protein n=1 Tax=Timema bartmani TaxID=61472 RepID=A0A7R9ET35_9NEOP|nr:unnamed protein product [Timema bartmani]